MYINFFNYFNINIIYRRHPEKYSRWLLLRDTNHDFLQSWCLRLQNIHFKPPAIVRFSILLHFHNCHSSIWNYLSHMRMALSKETTLRLITSMNSISYPDYFNWTPQKYVGAVGADNFGYYHPTKQVISCYYTY